MAAGVAGSLNWLKWNIITHEIFKETDKRKKDVEVWSSNVKIDLYICFIYFLVFFCCCLFICFYAPVNDKITQQKWEEERTWGYEE